MISSYKVDVTALGVFLSPFFWEPFLVSSPLLPGFDGRNPAHPCPVGL